jgi:ribosomal protein L16 Arg81 hydroxylase
MLNNNLNNNNFDFAKLLSPISIADFLEKHWETQSLHISGRSADFYQTLLSVEEMDILLARHHLKPPEIRVVANQQELLPDRYIKPDGSLNLNQLYKAYQEGHTLIINGLQQYWQPLAQACLNVQYFLNHSVVANCYLSPPNSKGLMPHYDTHDVFVLQIEGSKQWYLHPSTDPSLDNVPLLGSFQPVIPESRLGNPQLSIQLNPGDLLYVPRGCIHHATTFDDFSLHVTIGVYPAQWIDLVNSAITAIALRNAQLRKALPIGYLDNREAVTMLQETFQEILNTVAIDPHALGDGLEILRDRFIHQTTPLPDGHFHQLHQLEEVNLTSTVIKRSGLHCRVIRTGLDSASIQFPGNTISGKSHLESSFNFISNVDHAFKIAELPDTLTDDGKVTLVKRLIRGGLLRTVSH